MTRVKQDDGKCYVYCLLDTRKPGPFKYGRWVFSHEPFYVGKGTGCRASAHLRPNDPSRNLFKKRVIAKIVRETGDNPLILYKRTGLHEQEAHDLEVRLISAIGRYNAGLGPLTNLTDGGEGVLGKVWSSAERKRQAQKAAERYGAALLTRFQTALPKTFHGLTSKSKPTGSRSMVILTCQDGHSFKAEARSVLYGKKGICPHCPTPAKFRKLTDKQVAAIRKDKRTRREVAASYGVSIETVSHVWNGAVRFAS